MSKWIVVILVVAGCATREVAKNDNPERSPTSAAPVSEVGRVEIDYVRGNNLHRLVAVAQPDSATVEFFRDTVLTKQGRIDSSKYNTLIKQAEEILVSMKSEKLPVNGCRTPFLLKVEKQKEIRQLEGCRSDEQGALLGKFIRDAEYLVLSQR